MHISVVATMATALGTMLAVAAPAAADTTAVIATPACCVSDTIAYGGNVYALDQTPPGDGTEAATLLRIDPVTNAITGSVGLLDGPPSGNALDVSSMAVAAGSIWVTAYFENELLRVDPATMTITAAFAVGRSPSSVVSDGHSLWVALNNARAVVRIDPARNLVVQTVRVGSKDSADSPWQLAYDGRDLLASMPDSGRVAHIDAKAKVRYDNVGFDAASCAHLLPISGGYWLDDTECSPAYYRWDARRGRIAAVVDPTTDIHHDWGATIANGALYSGESDCENDPPFDCYHGYLVKRDIATGAELATQDVGIEAFLPHFASGSFWAADFDLGALNRVARF
jgi:hypothetical protein